MVSGTPPPLSVDPDELSAAGGELATAAEQLPAVPPPFMPVGGDPLSAAIIGQIPAIELPIETQLPLIKTQSTATAANVVDAAQMYRAADQRNGAAISQQMQTAPNAGSPAGSGMPPAAGGADPMSQMMGTPMQMAGQMAQMPMQLMGAVAAVPQGAMQGVQQAGQQVQQMVGQFGQGGTGNQSGGSESGSLPAAEPPQDQHTDAPAPEADQRQQDDGAASGSPAEERAPEEDGPTRDSDSPTGSPGRHRVAASDDGINL